MWLLRKVEVPIELDLRLLCCLKVSLTIPRFTQGETQMSDDAFASDERSFKLAEIVARRVI
jgi:hypothetical protein